jgi:transposase
MVREYCYAFAAVSPHDGVLVRRVLPAVNARTMTLFLAEVAARHAEEHILMVLDGAGWHKAADLRVPENIDLIPLPPYSPELNPAEHLWEEIREKWFPNLVFGHLSAVEDRLVQALHALEETPHTVASITGFEWVVSINMKAT